MTLSIQSLVGIFSGLLTVFVLVYKMGRTEGKITAKLDGLTAWITDLTGGKGPVCAMHDKSIEVHDEKLEKHGEQLEDHEERIGELEKQPRVRSRNPA